MLNAGLGNAEFVNEIAEMEAMVSKAGETSDSTSNAQLSFKGTYENRIREREEREGERVLPTG